MSAAGSLFSAGSLSSAGGLLLAGVQDRMWPGAVAAAGVGDEVVRQWVVGSLYGSQDVAMAEDTVFDLASLTKVLATLPVVLGLVDSGAVALDDPVARYVSGVDPRVTVRQLLTHTSGLPAHVRFTATTAEDLVAAAAAVDIEAEPGTRVAYSDLGFILLGGVVRAVTGSRIDVVVRSILSPLGVGARFTPPSSWLGRIAPTEVYDGVPTLGVVHDENAQTAGGVAGHAGLFGTLVDVVGCLPIWWPDGPVVSEALRAEAVRDATDGLGGHRGLGWTCRGDGYDILSTGWGAAVSHTGFTGTSIALHPATRRWAVLLTNQVHYGRGRTEVFAARRRWHATLVGD